MEVGALLDILGNKTRRNVLKLATQEPRYLTELKEETGVEKMALSRHLSKMVEAHVLNKRSERVKRGRPRTYYSVPGTTKLTVNITPDHFQAKVENPEAKQGGDVHSLRLKSIKSIEEPVKKLTALSELAEDLQKEIKVHEDAIHRLEGILNEIRRAGKEAGKQLPTDKVDRKILMHLMVSRSGGAVEEISRVIGEDIDSTEKHLRHLEDEGILGNSSSHWKLK
jgi:ArsR family transcriptional regulator